MSETIGEVMAQVGFGALKDLIREVVREELDQQLRPSVHVRERDQAVYRTATPLIAEAWAETAGRRAPSEGVFSGSPARSLGRWIVVDPAICHGKPTFRDTRIMVWQVLELLAQGMAWESIEEQWDGKVRKDAIAEAIQLASKSFLQQADALTIELAAA
jgi:uncharacterized protein (DUF433 family)